MQIAEIPKSLVSFAAKITLREWREGKLLFPCTAEWLEVLDGAWSRPSFSFEEVTIP